MDDHVIVFSDDHTRLVLQRRRCASNQIEQTVAPGRDVCAAVMCIGGEAPGGGPILSVGISAMFEYGFPPPRIVNSAVRRSQCECRVGKRMLFPGLQPAGRKTTP
jgi:hypothetical protein